MEWSEYKDKHAGETGLILCTGKSLNLISKEFMDKYVTIGLNGTFLLYQPTYYVSVNELVLEQFDIASVTGQKFIKAKYADRYKALPLVSDYRGCIFSKEPQNWIFEGGTVTYVALQIAYYMGFKTVIIVGLDHDYQTRQGSPNEKQLVLDDDVNHFTTNYFQKGMNWNLPDLQASETSYAEARRIYEEDDRRIINLTPGTKEQIFEKGEVKDFQ